MEYVRWELGYRWSQRDEVGRSIYSEMKKVATLMWRTWKRGALYMLVLASLPFLCPVLFLSIFVGLIFLVPLLCGATAYYLLFHSFSPPFSVTNWSGPPKSLPEGCTPASRSAEPWTLEEKFVVYEEENRQQRASQEPSYIARKGTEEPERVSEAATFLLLEESVVSEVGAGDNNKAQKDLELSPRCEDSVHDSGETGRGPTLSPASARAFEGEGLTAEFHANEELVEDEVAVQKLAVLVRSSSSEHAIFLRSFRNSTGDDEEGEEEKDSKVFVIHGQESAQARENAVLAMSLSREPAEEDLPVQERAATYSPFKHPFPSGEDEKQLDGDEVTEEAAEKNKVIVLHGHENGLVKEELMPQVSSGRVLAEEVNPVQDCEGNSTTEHLLPSGEHRHHLHGVEAVEAEADADKVTELVVDRHGAGIGEGSESVPKVYAEGEIVEKGAPVQEQRTDYFPDCALPSKSHQEHLVDSQEREKPEVDKVTDPEAVSHEYLTAEVSFVNIVPPREHTWLSGPSWSRADDNQAGEDEQRKSTEGAWSTAHHESSKVNTGTTDPPAPPYRSFIYGIKIREPGPVEETGTKNLLEPANLEERPHSMAHQKKSKPRAVPEPARSALASETAPNAAHPEQEEDDTEVTNYRRFSDKTPLMEQGKEDEQDSTSDVSPLMSEEMREQAVKLTSDPSFYPAPLLSASAKTAQLRKAGDETKKDLPSEVSTHIAHLKRPKDVRDMGRIHDQDIVHLLERTEGVEGLPTLRALNVTPCKETLSPFMHQRRLSFSKAGADVEEDVNPGALHSKALFKDHRIDFKQRSVITTFSPEYSWSSESSERGFDGMSTHENAYGDSSAAYASSTAQVEEQNSAQAGRLSGPFSEWSTLLPNCDQFTEDWQTCRKRWEEESRPGRLLPSAPNMEPHSFEARSMCNPLFEFSTPSPLGLKVGPGGKMLKSSLSSNYTRSMNRHSAPEILRPQAWSADSALNPPHHRFRDFKKGKYTEWPDNEGPGMASTPGRHARSYSTSFTEIADPYLGEFEGLLHYWRERDKSTNSPVSSPKDSPTPTSPAEVAHQIREEVNTIQRIIGHEFPPQHSLWKDVETLSQIVGVQLPYMGDVSDLTKARQGLDLLRIVVGIRWDVE